MTWVRHSEPPAPPSHQCTLPYPRDAEVGDLWRCDTCRDLWRVGYTCDACDVYGDRPHRGLCSTGLEWRPARWWQRIRYRDRGKVAS